VLYEVTEHIISIYTHINIDRNFRVQ